MFLGRCGSGGDCVLYKEYGCNLQDTFRLIGRAITMTSYFGVTCVGCELMAQWLNFRLRVFWSLV